MLTLHAQTQTAQRQIDPRLLRLAEYHSSKYEDAAIRLTATARTRCDDGSNGNELWAIARRYRLVTMFYRRSTQLDTPRALGVSQVIKL